MKISAIPLNQLYERKITTAVEKAIRIKEDFSRIAPKWCENVCTLPCKSIDTVSLHYGEIDVLIIQDYTAPGTKYRTAEENERTTESILEHIIRDAGLTSLRKEGKKEGYSYKLITLMKCESTPVNFPKGKPPTAITMMKCSPYLLAEISRAKPKIIISLSTVVTKALGLKKHSNTGNRGEIVPLPGNPSIPVIITLHPRVLTMIRQNASGAMWGADYLGVIIRDFQKAVKLLSGTLKMQDLQASIDHYRKTSIKVAKSEDEVKRFLAEINELSANKIISYDTETTGLDPLGEDARILCIQFGWLTPEGPQTRVVPLWHRENNRYDPDAVWPGVASLLTSDRPKVGHNVKFDILYIYHTTKVRVRNTVFDTMLCLHSIDSGIQGCYGLKVAVSDWAPELGITGYEGLLPKLGSVIMAEAGENDE